MASRVFAIDLGAWSVKLAIASPGLRGATLTEVVERLVPPGDESAEIRARRVLAQMIDEKKLRGDGGYIGVYGDQVFTQILEFGFKSLRRAELDKAVGGELEGVVPVDLEDMVYCFEPLPPAPAAAVPSPDAPPEMQRGRVAAPLEGMRVLSYAMTRERAQQLIDVGKQCGFDVRGILPVGGAAVRLVERTPSLARARQDGAVAVVDIGHERTDVVVVAAGKAVFSRSIARAGKHVTEAIARHWKKSFEDAERAKHAEGFVASHAEPATSDAWARIHEVTVAELSPFARDLRQTLAACRARTGFTALAVLLVGGGSRLRGIASFLGEQLAVPAWRLTPDDVAALAGPKLATANAVVPMPIDAAALTVGMAYDAAGGRPMFDLRSGSLAVSMDLTFLRAKAVPLGVAVLAISAFAAGSARANLYRLDKAGTVLANRLAIESALVYGKAKTTDEILGTTKTTGGSSSLAGGSPVPKLTAYDVLIELSESLPGKDKATIDVENIVVEPDQVKLSGTAKTSDEIVLILSKLKDVECFKTITPGAQGTKDVVRASGTKESVKTFEITIKAQCM